MTNYTNIKVNLSKIIVNIITNFAGGLADTVGEEVGFESEFGGGVWMRRVAGTLLQLNWQLFLNQSILLGPLHNSFTLLSPLLTISAPFHSPYHLTRSLTFYTTRALFQHFTILVLTKCCIHI